MRIALFSIFFVFCSSELISQQLYLEGFLSRNLTNYGHAPYQNNNNWHSLLGGRFALGADHIQIGAEYNQNLTDPNWVLKEETTGAELGEHVFNTTYYGLFLRSKISRYPARRFGVTLMAGSGLFETNRTSSVTGDPTSLNYDSTIGFTGGVGVSAPIAKVIMLEFGYHYYFVGYKETEALAELNGGFHSVQLGISFNFVFGKRAEKYNAIKGG